MGYLCSFLHTLINFRIFTTQNIFMIQIDIPVKKHVNKYLIRRYGAVHTISKKSFVGLLVLELVNNEVKKVNYDIIHCDKYTLLLPDFYFNTKGFTLDKNKEKFLGVCLERMFFEDFYHFVDVELAKGNLNAYKAVNLFLKLFNIHEDDVKLESMYRNYQRFCGEKIKVKKKLVLG